MPSQPVSSKLTRLLPARRLSAASAALVCLVAISACGSSSSSSSSSGGSSTTKTNLNIARVEASIKENIQTQRHLSSTVVCPQTVPQEAGKVFECVATTRATKAPHAPVKTPFVVTVHNSSGYVTFVGK